MWLNKYYSISMTIDLLNWILPNTFDTNVIIFEELKYQNKCFFKSRPT